MNLQNIPVQASQFPILSGFSNSKTEEYWQPRSNNTKQEARLKIEITEPEQKENLILKPETIAIIGENGRNRFNEFKTYTKGWYGGKGKEVSKGSVFVFEQFIKYLPKLKRATPSLFFTLEGNLQVGFEDKHGKMIEIEFFSDKVEYYLENYEEESFVKLADIEDLVKKVEFLLN